MQRTGHSKECKDAEQEQGRTLAGLRQDLTKLQDERRFGQTRRKVLSGDIAVLEQRIASAKSVHANFCSYEGFGPEWDSWLFVQVS
jgi:hypothetical protein